MSGRAAAARSLVTAPEDKRFRRARLGPATRRRRVRLALLRGVARTAVIAAMAVGTCWAAASFVLYSPHFRVAHISIGGNARLSSGEVIALLDGLHGRSLLRVTLAEWRDRVLGSPWVEDAELRRILPDTIEVHITERTPLGIGRVGGRLYLLDGRGGIIDDFGPQYADIDLPVIDGLDAACGGAACDDAGADQALARAQLAGSLLVALAGRGDLLERVSQVDVHDPLDAVVLLEGDTTLVHLGDRDFAERLQSYAELAPAIRARVPDTDYVDLRFGSRVFVRPSAAAAAGLRRAAGARPAR